LYIRECVTINRGTIASGQTVIGDNCLIMAHIAHDCHVGNNAILWMVYYWGHVTVGNYAIVGGYQLFINLSILWSCDDIWGSLLRKDVPPFTKAAKAFSYVELIL
jgi:UDP-N-acetylglucosamine acyltransferase